MMSVDVQSGQVYLQLKPRSKTEDVAEYFADLCEDLCQEMVERVSIVLDNNTTHKHKMKRLLGEQLIARGIAKKIEVEFIHTPAYSPEFNLAEYEIHLLRLKKLHHLPSNITIEEISEILQGVDHLMSPQQIGRTLKHIFSRVT